MLISWLHLTTEGSCPVWQSCWVMTRQLAGRSLIHISVLPQQFVNNNVLPCDASKENLFTRQNAERAEYIKTCLEVPREVCL